MKLIIELVPKTSWGNNLRKAMSYEDWDRVRKKTYAEYNYSCGVCGTGNTKLHCHEIWKYDDNVQVQKLIGFIALCELCHHIKHIGFAGELAQRGKLNYNALVKHFMKVNDCSKKAFITHREYAFRKWAERSKHNWTLDLGQYVNNISKP